MKQSKPSNNSGSSTNSSCTSNESVVIRRANEQQKTTNKSTTTCNVKPHDIKSLTPPSFRKENLIGGGVGGLGSGGSGGLYKSASAVSVGHDFSGSLTPVMHQRKTSYQLQHSFRMGNGLASSTKNEISNLIRVRNSALGKSAPLLSQTSVNKTYFIVCSTISQP